MVTAQEWNHALTLPLSRVRLTPGTWLMVTVRLSGWKSPGVVTAMPPCSAWRRSSSISCGRAWDQQGHGPPGSQTHRRRQAYTEKHQWGTRGQRYQPH